MEKEARVFTLLSLVLVLQSGIGGALRVGDPGVTFKVNKLDLKRYPQMKEWKSARARGGGAIPFIKDVNVKQTVNDGASSSDINSAMKEAKRQGGGAVLLCNGLYRINETVTMESNVYILGESRRGVKCVIYMKKGAAFLFKEGVNNSGIYRLTVEGSWEKPKLDWNIGDAKENAELLDNENVSVLFRRSTDCFLDQVSIINSADFPMRCAANHITFRDLLVDGVHNKQRGGHGYSFILQGHNLITGSNTTRLRHISLQGDGVRYKVVYDNDFAQEISFHATDDGENLIENNRITLPAYMPSKNPSYHAIMGPWASIHDISKRNNYIYKNKCVELNHNRDSFWSDDSKIYLGPIDRKIRDPFPASSKVPQSGTL